MWRCFLTSLHSLTISADSPKPNGVISYTGSTSIIPRDVLRHSSLTTSFLLLFLRRTREGTFTLHSAPYHKLYYRSVPITYIKQVVPRDLGSSLMNISVFCLCQTQSWPDLSSPTFAHILTSVLLTLWKGGLILISVVLIPSTINA